LALQQVQPVISDERITQTVWQREVGVISETQLGYKQWVCVKGR